MDLQIHRYRLPADKMYMHATIRLKATPAKQQADDWICRSEARG